MQFDLFPQKIYVVEKSCMPLTSIIHGYVSHQIDGTTFPAFSLWKAAEWVAQLTHRLNLPRSPLQVLRRNLLFTITEDFITGLLVKLSCNAMPVGTHCYITDVISKHKDDRCVTQVLVDVHTYKDGQNKINRVKEPMKQKCFTD